MMDDFSRQPVAPDLGYLVDEFDICDSESKLLPIAAISVDTRDEYSTFGIDGCEEFKTVAPTWAGRSRIPHDPGYYCLPDSPVL